MPTILYADVKDDFLTVDPDGFLYGTDRVVLAAALEIVAKRPVFSAAAYGTSAIGGEWPISNHIYTMSAWVKSPDVMPAGKAYNVCTVASNAMFLENWNPTTEQRHTMKFNFPGTMVTLRNRQTIINPGTWQHVAISLSYAGGTHANYRLMVDGVIREEIISGPSIPYSMAHEHYVFTVGANDENSFDGQIKNMEFWNYWRSAAEITASMNTVYDTAPANLLHYYRMNEGSGDILHDTGSVGGLDIDLSVAPYWQ